MADTVARLEPFLLMARSAKGAAAAKIISDATSASSVFGFGELLDMPNIQALATHEEHASSYKLLLLFAYGTYTNYMADTSVFPTLSQAQLTKLKQLTLVSLAHESRALPYSLLLQSLDIPTIRDLEDLIIDSMYSQVLGGRLDQKLSVLHVDWVIGRDVQSLSAGSPSTSASASASTSTTASQGLTHPLVPGGSATVQDLGQRLHTWCVITNNLLQSIDDKIQIAQREARFEKDQAAMYESSRNALCESLMDQGRNDRSGGGGGGGGKGKGKRAAAQGSGDFDDAWGAEQVENAMSGPMGGIMGPGGGGVSGGGGGEGGGGTSTNKKSQGRNNKSGTGRNQGGNKDTLDRAGTSPENNKTRRAPQDLNAPKRARRD